MANPLKKFSKVCDLSEEESNQLIFNKIQPDCRNHQHISPQEAWELCDSHKWGNRPGHCSSAEAEWVGPFHILRTRIWQIEGVSLHELSTEDRRANGIKYLRFNQLCLVPAYRRPCL